MTESLKAKPSQRAARLAAKGLAVSVTFTSWPGHAGWCGACAMPTRTWTTCTEHFALRSHWKLAAQRIAPISVQAAPRDRRISWPICFVVGFLGHRHRHVRTLGKTKTRTEAAETTIVEISAIRRQPNRPQRRSLCFVVHTQLYIECVRVCVCMSEWVSWRASQCDHAACKYMTKSVDLYGIIAQGNSTRKA